MRLDGKWINNFRSYNLNSVVATINLEAKRTLHTQIYGHLTFNIINEFVSLRFDIYPKKWHRIDLTV